MQVLKTSMELDEKWVALFIKFLEWTEAAKFKKTFPTIGITLTAIVLLAILKQYNSQFSRSVYRKMGYIYIKKKKKYKLQYPCYLCH